MKEQLKRTTFTTSRLLEFFTEKELQMQIGHATEHWPIAILKELIDNALDACETTGVPPEIQIKLEKDAIAVEDNGPGLPQKILERSLDYAVRISDKNHYVSPTRGQLGNALKCVWAAPFVATGKPTCIEAATGGKVHRIEVSLNQVMQKPEIRLSKHANGLVKNGTSVKIHWPGIASLLAPTKSPEFYNRPMNGLTLFSRYAAFNPHASFRYHSGKIYSEHITSNSGWQKWRPDNPTSPHWYSPASLRSLVSAYLRAETEGSSSQKTVREFVSEFCGLSGTAKQKRVTELAGLSGAYLHNLMQNDEVPSATIEKLLAAMQAESRPVNSKALGVIGPDHLKNWLLQQHCQAESVRYKMIVGKSQSLPFVLEVAFGIYAEDYDECECEIVVGLNWTPAIKIPFEELSTLLGARRIDSFDPVMVVVHLACPRLEFVDRGKGRLRLSEEMQAALKKAVNAVTRTWKTAKRQADREDRLMKRQLDELRKAQRRDQMNMKEAAFEVMPMAYGHASADGKFPANARQIMYAARPQVLELTGGKNWKDSAYFTQRLLPEFVEKNPELTANWDVVYDARGKLVEPHTGMRIDLGTLAVREYIAGWRDDLNGAQDLPELQIPHRMSTNGPASRYRFALFVEKEGFNELLNAVHLAERYDLAIMSTKGMSVTAARQLVAELSKQAVTVLVLHDFDKAGFSIVHTLRSDTLRWRYEATPRVIDLGLRLEDVTALGLQSEPVVYRSAKDPRDNLTANGATVEECEFLVRGRGQGQWHGERVEINAMTSAQLVEWLESKLQKAGVRKIVPNDKVLRAAYQQAYRMASIKSAAANAARQCRDLRIKYPKGLKHLIHEQLTGSVQAWDDVVFDLALDAHQRHVDEKAKPVGRIKR